MSRVKGKNTKPEMLVRKFLHAQGFRYTLHGKYKGNFLPGKPDLILQAYKSVVFVHGCFWHAHNDCKYFRIPESRKDFWTEKLYGNRDRDEKNIHLLKKAGWNVFVIWTCQLKKAGEADKTLKELSEKLASQKS
jgi:DNA mismatch endonuclease (patch repair protein)